jgi:hypothetical protein
MYDPYVAGHASGVLPLSGGNLNPTFLGGVSSVK